MLFEVSWEVCNKVGGIFTVLSTKARQVKRYYKNGYCLIGPYIDDKSRSMFKENSIPAEYQSVYNELKELGVVCHFGTWLIDSEPKVILLDYRNFWHRLDEIKREMWDSFKLDSLNSSHRFNEPVLWSWTAGMLVEKMSMIHHGRKIIMQAHEWLSGAAILYANKNAVEVSTVFTTHATSLGRTLAGNGVDLYSVLDRINPDEEAYKFGIQAKHNMERITAKVADVFTTVSQITAMEARYILKKDVDVVLPNGLDMSKFPSFEETALKHKMYRNKLREFALYYFFPYYNVDLKNTLFFFTASRYEFHNKGIDIFIKTLGKLNKKMKKNNNKKTVIVFFWVPSKTDDIKPEIAEAREVYRDIEDLLEEKEDDIKENLLYAITSEEKISRNSIFDSDFILSMKRKVLRLKSKSGSAPLTTHELLNEENDQILKAFKEAGLENKEEDKVKVIFYPVYLNGADGLGDLDYYQSIQACHFGAFPSYYEPWGYTPLETAALGVVSLTSNLSGFGKYFSDALNKKNMSGIHVLDMQNKNEDEIVNDFVNILYRYTFFTKKKRIDNKIQACKSASMADWKNFVKYYIKAHNLAADRDN